MTVTWTLRAEPFDELETAHHQFLFRVIGLQRGLFVNGGAFSRVPWHGKARKRLPGRVMSGTRAGGENPRPGGQFKTWHRCTVENLREFRATEGSTENFPFVFGVDSVLWSSAAKKAGKWYRMALEATERFMVTWHEDEAQLCR